MSYLRSLGRRTKIAAGVIIVAAMLGVAACAPPVHVGPSSANAQTFPPTTVVPPPYAPGYTPSCSDIRTLESGLYHDLEDFYLNTPHDEAFARYIDQRINLFDAQFSGAAANCPALTH